MASACRLRGSRRPRESLAIAGIVVVVVIAVIILAVVVLVFVVVVVVRPGNR